MTASPYKKPCISVLMSIYEEPEEWMRASINSILQQTFADFEFLIINDNPLRKLNSIVLEGYQQLDSRIRIIENEANLGLTKSLNIGLREAKGRFIARMDADDFAFPERFEIQIKYLHENLDCIACSALAYIWDGSRTKGIMHRPTSYLEILFYSFTSSPFIHPLLMIKRELLDAYSLCYDENFKRSQDYKLAIDMLKSSVIGNVNRPLLKYRISKQQITAKFGWEQDVLTKRIRRELINWYYEKYSLPLLSNEITVVDLIDNYRYENEICMNKKISNEEKNEFYIAMNCIRRLLYYSLSSYSWHSLWIFLKSKDYLKKPYKVRRFVVVVLKHVNPEIVSKLL